MDDDKKLRAVLWLVVIPGMALMMGLFAKLAYINATHEGESVVSRLMLPRMQPHHHYVPAETVSTLRAADIAE